MNNLSLYGIVSDMNGKESIFAQHQPCFMEMLDVFIINSKGVRQSMNIEDLASVYESQEETLLPIKLNENVWTAGESFIANLEILNLELPHDYTWVEDDGFYYTVGTNMCFEQIIDDMLRTARFYIRQTLKEEKNDETIKIITAASNILAALIKEDQLEDEYLLGASYIYVEDQYLQDFHQMMTIEYGNVPSLKDYLLEVRKVLTA
jgi:hypothetical protein